jgi:hypothetical protein
VQSQIMVPDPATGQFLVGTMEGRETPDRHLFAVDVERNAWKKLPVTMPPGRWVIAAAVPNYDVVMLCTCRPAKVCIYKHKSPFAGG